MYESRKTKFVSRLSVAKRKIRGSRLFDKRVYETLSRCVVDGWLLLGSLITALRMHVVHQFGTPAIYLLLF